MRVCTWTGADTVALDDDDDDAEADESDDDESEDEESESVGDGCDDGFWSHGDWSGPIVSVTVPVVHPVALHAFTGMA